MQLSAQKLKHIGTDQTSVTIMQAIKDQVVEGSGASSESLAKIADCLSLKSNQELLIEAVALEKLKENAEQAEKTGEAEYIESNDCSCYTHARSPCYDKAVPKL